MSTNDYKIIPYNHDYAAELAQMWNESDEQWPGTFTQGVPFTKERIVDWMSSFDPLLNLIVVDKEGAVVGYGSLEDTANQSGRSCYVPLLNVHPDHQGRSLCRRILQKMVIHASNNSYERITIGTWPGNLKSVPLYKKVGFFWKPGLDVGMENYIPTLLNLPATRDFFAQANWYRDFQRELAQIPDKQQHPATGRQSVYIMRWQQQDKRVEAVFGVDCQALVGLDVLSFNAYAKLDEPKPIQGLRYPISWQIHNKQEEPMPVQIKATAATGIDISCEECFTLAPGETRTVHAHYRCRNDAPPINYDEKFNAVPRPAIHAALRLGATPLTLTCGVSYRPALTLSLDEATPTMVPGQDKTVLVQLHNRLDVPLTGLLRCHAEAETTASWTETPFTVAASGFAAVPLTLRREQAGTNLLGITAVFTHQEQTVTVNMQKTAVLATPLGSVAAAHIPDVETSQTALVVSNPFYKATACRDGGQLKLWAHGVNAPHVYLQEELGKPHLPADLGKQPYELTLQTAVGQATATFTARSTRFPGLKLSRILTFTASPLIQIQYRLENSGQETHTCYVQTVMGMLHADWDNAQAIIPRRDQLTIAPASHFWMNDGDLPRTGAEMAEQWTAVELDGRLHALIWPDNVERHEVHWNRLELVGESQPLPPGAVVNFAPLYLYCGSGDWQTVQRLWAQLTNSTPSQRQPAAPLTVQFAPGSLLTSGNKVATTVTVNTVQGLTLNGRLTLTPPPNWQASASETSFDTLTNGQPHQLPLQLQANDDIIGPASGTLRLETNLRDTVQPFTILRLGDGETAVSAVKTNGADDKPLWQLANGRCRWQITPHYNGGIVGWYDGNETINQLLTLYPDTDGVFEAFKPWFGGIQPVLRRALDDWDNWPGKFYSETFHASPIAVPDSAGLPWQGVRVATTLQREGFEGLHATLDYLTLGRSNVLKLRFTLHNQTDVVRTAVPGFHTYLQVDGNYHNSTLHSDGEQRKRNKMDHMFWYGSWSAAENPDSGRALAIISASGRRRTQWLDWGSYGGHFAVEEPMQLRPHCQQTLTAYMVLAESVAVAEAYQTLSQGAD